MAGKTHLLVAMLSLLSMTWAISYSPCNYTLDITTNSSYRITCTDPLTADEVLGVFSQTPINSNIQHLTLRNLRDSNDSVINQIINRVAASQETLALLVLDQVNITRIPTGVKLFPNLGALSLVNNKLESLAPGSMNISSKLLVLGMQNVGLTTIEPGTFDEANWSTTDMGLQGNQLTQFPASVFQRVLESMVGDDGFFAIGGSTITCDCSVAWLLRDQRHLLQHVRQGKCSSGLDFEAVPSSVFDPCPTEA